MNELWCLSVSRLSSLPDCREDDRAAGESRSSLLSVIELDLEDAPVMESDVCGIVISIALLGISVAPDRTTILLMEKSAMDDAAEQDPSHGSDWAEAPESFR